MVCFVTFQHDYTKISETILKREQMENLVFEGFKFMLLGMGTVFTFLSLMIIAMNVQKFVIHKFFPEPMPISDSETGKKNNAKIAAISAAIQHHENSK